MALPNDPHDEYMHVVPRACAVASAHLQVLYECFASCPTTPCALPCMVVHVPNALPCLIVWYACVVASLSHVHVH